jgi:hypothetical protein
MDGTLAGPGEPSAAKLLRRLSAPVGAGGLESATLEGNIIGVPDSRERLEAAKALLKRLAANDPEVREEEVDRIIRDAEEGFRKLDGEGEGAELSTSEIFGLEAVIEADGSRPVLFVQDGTIDLEAPALRESLAARWQGAAAQFRSGIERVAAAVGAVQLPAFLDERGKPRRIGTAFAIAPGLVLTNRHVLEELARYNQSRWTWTRDAEVDFAGEYERDAECRFKVVEVHAFGAEPINRRVNFARADYAVLRLEGDADFPKPLSLEPNPARVTVGAVQPPIYVVGFPAKPLVAEPSPGEGPPAAGHEYAEVLERLYRNRFGSKRWAPGLVEAGPGQVAGDARKWIMTHDSSTLGGNSGSCVVDFQHNGERVVGLHFGGQPRVENYAHVLATLRQELADIGGLAWAT